MKLTVYPPEAEQAGCSLSYSESSVSKSASYESGQWHFDVTHSGKTFVVTPKFSDGWVCYVNSITVRATEGSRRVFNGEVQDDDEWTVELPYSDMGSLRPRSIPWDDSVALNFIDQNPTSAFAWDAILSDLTTVNSGSTAGGFTSEETRWYRVDEIIVTFQKDPNIIQVIVSASPPDGGVVSGGGLFNVGDTVTISASPNDGYVFSNWSDGTIVSTQASYSFTANENRTLIAKFEEIAWLDVQVLAHEGVPIANLPISIGGTTYHTDENGRFHIDKFVQGRCDIRCPNIVYGDYTDVRLGRIYTDSPRTFIPFSTTSPDATFIYQGYGQYYVSGSTTLYIEYVRLGFCVGTQKLIDLLYAWSKDPPHGGAEYDFVYLEYFDNFYRDRVEWYKAYAAIQDHSPDVVAPLNTKDSSGTIGRLKLHSMQEVLDVYGNIFTANGRYLSGNVNDLTLNYDKDGESTEEERSSIPEVVVEQLKHYGYEKCPLVIVDANYLDKLFDVHVYATDETFSKTGNVVLELESSFSVKSSTYPYEDITYSFANDYEVVDKETTISGVAPKKGAFTVRFKNSYTTHPRPVVVKIDGVTAKAIQVGDYNKYIYDVSESSKHRIDIYFSTFNGLLYDPESDGLLFGSKSERLIYITPNSL